MILNLWKIMPMQFKIGLGIATIAAVLTLAGYIWYRGWSACKESVEVKTLKTVTEIVEKKNAIRNNRPDAVALVGILRTTKF